MDDDSSSAVLELAVFSLWGRQTAQAAGDPADRLSSVIRRQRRRGTSTPWSIQVYSRESWLNRWRRLRLRLQVPHLPPGAHHTCPRTYEGGREGEGEALRTWSHKDLAAGITSWSPGIRGSTQGWRSIRTLLTAWLAPGLHHIPTMRRTQGPCRLSPVSPLGWARPGVPYLYGNDQSRLVLLRRRRWGGGDSGRHVLPPCYSRHCRRPSPFVRNGHQQAKA